MSSSLPHWRALSPSIPLPPGDPRYVPRPRGGDRLALMVRNGLGPLVVSGPSGAGRSTELGRLMTALQDDMAVLDVALDQLLDLATATPDLVLFDVARSLLERVVVDTLYDDVQPSHGLLKDMQASDPRFPKGHGKERPVPELAAMALGEVEVALGRGPLVLVFDGLDRAPPQVAMAASLALLSLSETAHLVMVVDEALVNGPVSHPLVSRARVVPLQALPVDPDHPDGEAGHRVLREILARRLEVDALPDDFEPVLQRAANLSGGLPRHFLELMGDAAAYGGIEGRMWPELPDLEQAVVDAADSMRRLLRDGDLEALSQAEGTSGLEVPIKRRGRFLGQGLLLERPGEQGPTVWPHPLLEGPLERHRSADA